MNLDKLIDYLEEELLCDQKLLNRALLENPSDKYLASFYEGCCATLRSVILNVKDMENEK